MQYTGAELRAKLKTLPDDVRSVVVAPETGNTLAAMAKQHALSKEQQEALGTDVGLILLGLMQPNTFTASLSLHLGLTQQDAQSIAHEVNAEIFNPIRSSLKKIYGLSVWNIGFGPESDETPTSLWSSMENKRKNDSVPHILDIMIRLREYAPD